MLYVITGRDKPQGGALRQQHRDAHLAYWQSHREKLRFGGPFIDEQGAMSGSMLALEAADYDEARRLAENDPFHKAGLFAELEVRGWTWLINAPKT